MKSLHRMHQSKVALQCKRSINVVIILMPCKRMLALKAVIRGILMLKHPKMKMKKNYHIECNQCYIKEVLGMPQCSTGHGGFVIRNLVEVKSYAHVQQ